MDGFAAIEKGSVPFFLLPGLKSHLRCQTGASMKITAVLTFAIAIASVLLTACSTDLTEAGSKVRLLDSADEASKCQLIKPIFARGRHALIMLQGML